MENSLETAPFPAFRVYLPALSYSEKSRICTSSSESASWPAGFDFPFHTSFPFSSRSENFTGELSEQSMVAFFCMPSK